jgi:hypothetical protein
MTLTTWLIIELAFIGFFFIGYQLYRRRRKK